MKNQTPSFSQLKKTFLDSGYEIRFFPRHDLEGLALDAPAEVKRHLQTNIMGLIIPDEDIIGIAKDLSVEDRVLTLIHELIHLYNDDIDEDDVESMTQELEQSLTPEQYGFFQFLVS
jgi:hypothetical protein